MKQYIEFKKQRELGEILSDTFAFIRNEFKPFFSAFLKIVGPYLAVMLVCYGFYLYKVNGFLVVSMERADNGFDAIITILVVFALLAVAVATYALSQATVLSYIKSYANTKGNTNFEEIKKEAYSVFWPMIGLGILVGLCVGTGLMFCIIPGVYLYVPLVLSFPILVFNQKSVLDAFSYSFTLVKDHWWMTFAALFVVGIIVGVASYAFALPAQLYSLANLGIWSGEVDAENFNAVDPVSIILGTISTLAQFLLNIISVVAGVLIYFDLNEKKNFTGTYERIEKLGGTTD